MSRDFSQAPQINNDTYCTHPQHFPDKGGENDEPQLLQLIKSYFNDKDSFEKQLNFHLKNLSFHDLHNLVRLIWGDYDFTNYIEYLSELIDLSIESFDNYDQLKDLFINMLKTNPTNSNLGFERIFIDRVEKCKIELIQANEISWPFIDWIFNDPAIDDPRICWFEKLRDLIKKVNEIELSFDAIPIDLIEGQFDIFTSQFKKMFKVPCQVDYGALLKSIFYIFTVTETICDNEDYYDDYHYVQSVSDLRDLIWKKIKRDKELKDADIDDIIDKVQAGYDYCRKNSH